MKKVTAILCATALVSVIPATPAIAQPYPASVDENVGCGGFVPDENGNPESFLFTNTGHSVIAKKGSKTKLVCHFEIPEGQIPSSVRKAEGFICGTYLGITQESKMLATPDGDATLWCTLEPAV